MDASGAVDDLTFEEKYPVMNGLELWLIPGDVLAFLYLFLLLAAATTVCCYEKGPALCEDLAATLHSMDEPQDQTYVYSDVEGGRRRSFRRASKRGSLRKKVHRTSMVSTSSSDKPRNLSSLFSSFFAPPTPSKDSHHRQTVTPMRKTVVASVTRRSTFRQNRSSHFQPPDVGRRTPGRGGRKGDDEGWYSLDDERNGAANQWGGRPRIESDEEYDTYDEGRALPSTAGARSEADHRRSMSANDVIAQAKASEVRRARQSELKASMRDAQREKKQKHSKAKLLNLKYRELRSSGLPATEAMREAQQYVDNLDNESDYEEEFAELEEGFGEDFDAE